MKNFEGESVPDPDAVLGTDDLPADYTPDAEEAEAYMSSMDDDYYAGDQASRESPSTAEDFYAPPSSAAQTGEGIQPAAGIQVTPQRAAADDFYTPGSEEAAEMISPSELFTPWEPKEVSAGPDRVTAEFALEKFFKTYERVERGEWPFSNDVEAEKFRRLSQGLGQDPAFNDVYRSWQESRYWNETIMDSQGRVGPRWEVEKRGWQEQMQRQLDTLRSAGPFALTGMLIEYARSGDVDRAIDVGERLRAADRLAKGAGQTGAELSSGSRHPEPPDLRPSPSQSGSPPDRTPPAPPDR